MKRLLVIYCPVNPRSLHQHDQEDLDITGPAERFRWCLLQFNPKGSAAESVDHGTGGLPDVPFAEEALVLLPTIDVRLIQTKVPLVASKKLEALLPTLTEPYLLEQRAPLRYQLFPPITGTQGINRTIAVSSDAWMTWLEAALASLPVKTLRMIPDCLLLEPPGQDAGNAHQEFLVNQAAELAVISTREGENWGCGWLEFGNGQAMLQSAFPAAHIQNFDWSWFVPRVLAWQQRKSPINLMRSNTDIKKAGRSVNVKTVARWQPKVRWGEWQRPAKLGAIAGGVYLVGSLLYLATLVLSNWRWENTLIATVRPQLATPPPEASAVLPAYVKQAVQRIHAQGQDTPADFLPMASRLQVLLNIYPTGTLESIQFDRAGLTFTLRANHSTPDKTVLLKRASSMEIALVPLAKNEYRMLPLAGLPMGGSK